MFIEKRREPVVVCAICGSDEDVVVATEADGERTATCTGRGHAEPRSWPVSAKVRVAPAPFFQRELGCALLGTIRCLGCWAEHGVVEHRFAVEHRRWYTELVEQFNHTANPGSRFHTRTASGHISLTLGALRDQGHLWRRKTEATGWWSFDHRISAWASQAVDPSAPILSWAGYAKSLGIDPKRWPLEDLTL